MLTRPKSHWQTLERSLSPQSSPDQLAVIYQMIPKRILSLISSSQSERKCLAILSRWTRETPDCNSIFSRHTTESIQPRWPVATIAALSAVEIKINALGRIRRVFNHANKCFSPSSSPWHSGRERVRLAMSCLETWWRADNPSTNIFRSTGIYTQATLNLGVLLKSPFRHCEESSTKQSTLKKLNWQDLCADLI